jgi:hypothetical protein
VRPASVAALIVLWSAVAGTIELQLSELMRDLVVEVVDPPAAAGRAHLSESARKDGTVHYIVSPAAPLAAGNSVTLRFSYSGGEKIAPQFAIDPVASFAFGGATAWYPQLAVDADARAVGTLKVVVPAGYEVVAPGERRGEGEFELRQPAALSFAAGRYLRVHRDGAVPMNALLLRPRSNVSAYLDGCARVLDLLIQEFGPYAAVSPRRRRRADWPRRTTRAPPPATARRPYRVSLARRLRRGCHRDRS